VATEFWRLLPLLILKIPGKGFENNNSDQNFVANSGTEEK